MVLFLKFNTNDIVCLNQDLQNFRIFRILDYKFSESGFAEF
jgi:hypothetical protein